MAHAIYLKLTGEKQGLISAGCSSIDSIGNKSQSGHEDQIFIIKFMHTITRAQNVQHLPVEFIKPLDKSSPLLLMAISENEKLTLEFDFYRTAQSGAQEKYYSIQLKKCTITSLDVHYPHAINHAGDQPEEKLSIRYEDITCKHLIAGTSGYSMWSDRTS